jgi:hypothetical protein
MYSCTMAQKPPVPGVARQQVTPQHSMTPSMVKIVTICTAINQSLLYIYDFAEVSIDTPADVSADTSCPVPGFWTFDRCRPHRGTVKSLRSGVCRDASSSSCSIVANPVETWQHMNLHHAARRHVNTARQCTAAAFIHMFCNNGVWTLLDLQTSTEQETTETNQLWLAKKGMHYTCTVGQPDNCTSQ